ncbi:hypothetical protein MCOR25_009227 [Pyricularia grisea]|nr:hypothetical protein MCOR25_009227 [Pyricularia grisea]
MIQTTPVPFPPSSSQTLIIEPKTVKDTIKSSSSRQKVQARLASHFRSVPYANKFKRPYITHHRPRTHTDCGAP